MAQENIFTTVGHLAGRISSFFSFPASLASSSRTPTSRIAVPADLDELVDVVLASMPDDPQWPYRFPYRHQYPEDHRYFTRMLYEKFIDPAYDDWVVMVVEDQVPGSSKRAIVAFAVWCLTYVNKRNHWPSYEPQNRESLLDHVNRFSRG